MREYQQYPFEVILKRIKLGAKVHRKSWEDNGKVLNYLYLKNGVIVIHNAKKDIAHMWVVGQDDMLASDWIDPAE